ncbi:MAG: hypothetical protein F6J93_26890 [Oscillatoria sp. SIO1A7]|nr:hypothetical protein [Oscillatoria sp. SIO1A7]
MNQLAFSVEGIRTSFGVFFAQFKAVCISLSGKAVAIGSAAFGRAVQFAKGPAFPYVVGGIAVVGVGVGCYYGWQYYKQNRESKRREEAIDALEGKIQELSKQPNKLRSYLKSGEFVRELFGIAGITRSEIEGAKDKVNYYLRCLSEYGYGDLSNFIAA